MINRIGILCLIIYSVNSQSIDYPDNFNSNNRYQNNGYNNNQGLQQPNQYQNSLNRNGPPYTQTQNPLNPFNPIQPVIGAINNTLQNAYGTVKGFLNNTFGGPGPVEMRSYVRLQLQGYLDQGFRLNQSTLCQCPPGPSGDECISNSPSRKGYACYFNFMIVVASTSPDVLYDSTPFILFDSGNGNIHPGQIEMDKFKKLFEFRTNSKITGLTIIVNHNGASIDAATGKVLEQNGIFNVDRFTINFDNNTQQYGQQVTSQLQGETLGTSLQLTYTVGCEGNLYGPGCNLQCNRSSINPQIAACRDIDNGYYSTCQWTSNNYNVQNCEHCPWGVRDGSYCVDEEGNMLESNQAGVVSSDYKTATIILAILAGVLLLCLIGAMIAVALARRQFNNSNNSAAAPGYNNRNIRGGHVGNAEAQPLNSSNERPTPPIRYTPNKKPIIRSPPAAHYGGDMNDTLNTSFASQSPMNVSRSADV